MMWIIMYIVFAIITQFWTYKWIRRLDKKERAKLQKWEVGYLSKVHAHFDIDKVNKEYNDMLKDLNKASDELEGDE